MHMRMRMHMHMHMHMHTCTCTHADAHMHTCTCTHAHMQVGDERREWRNGKLMLFDTSVMHCAANEAAVDRYVLMLRVWHPGLSSFEIDALSWIFKCLDNPQLAAPPPTDWSNPGRPEPTPRVAQAAAREPAAAPRATSGMSRQARRQAEKKAKKSAKAKGGRGFG